MLSSGGLMINLHKKIDSYLLQSRIDSQMSKNYLLNVY